ncbi:MAG: DUF1343 domain-containing protein [Bacteroidales bacterium]
MKSYLVILASVLLLCSLYGCATELPQEKRIKPGAEQIEKYLPDLKGKRVAIVANQTSRVANAHLVDTLLALSVDVVKIFSPEHGFRGTKEAGEIFTDGVDAKTGLPLISLYGANKKPKADDLTDVDLVLFDIQDVGVRFYTYLSTLHYVMEGCAEQEIPLIVLDRPNPNGFYIDGPVLDTTNYTSFIGLHPVPVVYGMTIGEYGMMINGEHWYKGTDTCELAVIPVEHYTHDSLYELPIAPSPNLRSMQAVYLYPSLAFFEGTIVSVGRGTERPFTRFGHPDLADSGFSFTPQSIPGASKNPKFKGETCFGKDLSDIDVLNYYRQRQLDLSWLLETHAELKEEHSYFLPFFYQLSGTKRLRKQIEQGFTEEQIRSSWQRELTLFKEMRKKYLLYE